MLVAAARRGAKVRVLLDSFFDDGEALRSNRATADYLNTLAATEGLDMQARTGNPTGGGIHMKLELVKVGDETWTAIGSLNGGEVSHKINREVVLMVEQPTLPPTCRIFCAGLGTFFRQLAQISQSGPDLSGPGRDASRCILPLTTLDAPVCTGYLPRAALPLKNLASFDSARKIWHPYGYAR